MTYVDADIQRLTRYDRNCSAYTVAIITDDSHNTVILGNLIYANAGHGVAVQGRFVMRPIQRSDDATPRHARGRPGRGVSDPETDHHG